VIAAVKVNSAAIYAGEAPFFASEAGKNFGRKERLSRSARFDCLRRKWGLKTSNKASISSVENLLWCALYEKIGSFTLILATNYLSCSKCDEIRVDAGKS